MSNEDSDQTAQMHRLVWIFTGTRPEGKFSEGSSIFFGLKLHLILSYELKDI